MQVLRRELEKLRLKAVSSPTDVKETEFPEFTMYSHYNELTEKIKK